MTFLRFAPRHVHHTVARHVEDKLAELGWTTPGQTPLGAPVLTFQHEAPISRGGGDRKVTAGLVSITLGNEFAPDMEEMGGPLASQDYPIFIDCFMASEGEAVSLASDIRDILMGRFPGCPRWLPVINQATGTPVDGWMIELDDIDRAAPDSNYNLYWQVVKVTAVVYYPEVVY